MKKRCDYRTSMVTILLVLVFCSAGWTVLPLPHFTQGTLSSASDGRLDLTFEGSGTEIWLFVDDGTLGDAIQVFESGHPVKHVQTRYDISAEGTTISGVLATGQKDFDFTGTLSGTGFSGTYSGSASGTISGSLVSWNTLSAGEDALAATQWPVWSGPNHNYTASDERLLLDRLSDARFVWRSEEATPNSLGSISRSAKVSDEHPIGGGGASPVLSDGRVFLNYFVPSGDVYDTSKLSKLSDVLAQYEQEFGTRAVEEEKSRWLINADDILVCLDAQTGERLWKTVFAEKGVNWQDHKGGPNNNTPVIGNGRVYSIGSTGRVYCVDATTGQAVWEKTVGPYHDNLRSQKLEYLSRSVGGTPFFGTGRGVATAPIFVNGVVVLFDHNGSLRGLDGDDGTLLWEYEGVLENNPVVWTNGGTEYVVTLTQESMICLNPADGTKMWETPLLGPVSHGPTIHGDFATLYVGSRALAMVTCGRLSPDGFEQLWTSGELGGLNHYCPPLINNGYVYATYSTQTICLDKMTGEVLSVVDNLYASRNGHMQIVEDRLLVQYDGRHGDVGMHMLGARENDFSEMGSEWHPPQYGTTAYADGFITHPYVDGRMFIRGGQGIYCYDLRSENSTLNTTISAPTHGHTILTTDSVDITMEVTGPGTEVTLFVDGEEIWSGSPGDANTGVKWGTPVRGTHRIYASVQDASGRTKYSEVVGLTVNQAPCEAEPQPAFSPDPAEDSQDASVFGTLSWNADKVGVDVATSYILHLGTDQSPPVLDTLEGIDQTSFWPGTLEGNTTYYWKIVSLNECGRAESPLWSFTTEAFTGFRYLRFRPFGRQGGGLNAQVNEIEWKVDGEAHPQNKLTANTSAGMSVTASTNNQEAYKVYDGKTSTYWSMTPPATLTLDLGPDNAIVPTTVHMNLSSQEARRVNAIEFYGSQDAQTWVKLFSGFWPGGSEAELPLQPTELVVDSTGTPTRNGSVVVPIEFSATAGKNTAGPALYLRSPGEMDVQVWIYDLRGRTLAKSIHTVHRGENVVALKGLSAHRTLLWKIETVQGIVLKGRISTLQVK